MLPDVVRRGFAKYLLYLRIVAKGQDSRVLEI